MAIEILYEDQHLLCIMKPQGIPSQGDLTLDEDLMTMALAYLKDKQTNPYLGLVHRLDRPVGGVILYAKTALALKDLSRQIQDRRITKEYLTVVCGKSGHSHQVLEDYLKQLKTINMSKVTTPQDKSGKLAKLEYQVLDSIETSEYGILTLLKVKLYTGRHHQIRVQLSHHGLPIWGDNKYNKVFMKKKEFTQIALWSYKFGFYHPRTKKYMEFTHRPASHPFNLFNIDTLLD